MSDDAAADRIETAIRAALSAVAPEADLAALDPAADLREALDIDSFDFLKVIVALHDKLGVDVPEADYPLVRTLAGCRRYLAQRPVDMQRPVA